MRGEAVTVRRPVVGKRDAMNATVLTWSDEVVDNVLVSPAATSDVSDSVRPDGTVADLTLHFPREYQKPLRGCHVVVRGEEFEVIGDPAPYQLQNTPTPWAMPASVRRIEG